MVDKLSLSLVDVYRNAVNYLAKREYSAYELKNKLLQQGFDEAAIDDALKKLQQEKLQSDERFTEMLIRTRQNQGYGPVRIQYELNEKGIDVILQETYVLFDDECWFELAKQVRQKKFGSTMPKDFKTKAKQMKFLQYRGFSMSHIEASLMN